MGFSIKWNLIWICIHAFNAFWITALLSNFTNIGDFLFYMIFGFLITFMSNFIRKFTAHKKFEINFVFFFWIVVNSFSIFGGIKVINHWNVSTGFWFYILLGVSLVIITFIVRQLKLYNFKLITSIVLILVLFFSTSHFSLFSYVSQISDSSNTNLSDGGIDEKIEIENGTLADYNTEPKVITMPYYLRGKKGSINFTVYGGVNNYLKDLPRSIISYSDVSPTDKDFIDRFLTEEHQNRELDSLVIAIKNKISDRDDQARIAISLVQHIPYDFEGLNSGKIEGKYPYEVLYNQLGVCSEKTNLLVYILSKLGFATAIFNFDKENHSAVGIKCPKDYSYSDTDYCFVESTTPSIITYSNGDYAGAGHLTSRPQVIVISDGFGLNSVKEEYDDASNFNSLDSYSVNRILPKYKFEEWRSLVKKYDIKISYS